MFLTFLTISKSQTNTQTDRHQPSHNLPGGGNEYIELDILGFISELPRGFACYDSSTNLFTTNTFTKSQQ